MWRDGEDKPQARPRWPVLGPKLKPSGNTRSQNGRSRWGNRVDLSGLRDDRGRLEGRDHGILKGVTITLEQHPPLESARAHNGKTGQDLFPQGPEAGRHQ